MVHLLKIRIVQLTERLYCGASDAMSQGHGQGNGVRLCPLRRGSHRLVQKTGDRNTMWCSIHGHSEHLCSALCMSDLLRIALYLARWFS